MTRDCSTLMVAQYFKRKREFVEIFIVSGSGMGIAVMSSFIKGAIRYVMIMSMKMLYKIQYPYHFFVGFFPCSYNIFIRMKLVLTKPQ